MSDFAASDLLLQPLGDADFSNLDGEVSPEILIYSDQDSGYRIIHYYAGEISTRIWLAKDNAVTLAHWFRQHAPIHKDPKNARNHHQS